MEPGPGSEESADTTLERSSLGLDANVAGLLCYLLGFITGIVFWVIETKSTFVRFHAIQSTFIFVGLFIIQIASSVIPILGIAINALASLAALVLWIILMIKAFQGERFKLPIVGDMAEERATFE